ncbi:hypothetical protein [Leptospira ilyithenensis]|uniref:Uncharacterized protein n=1 Tax=Leptospira ilyithenensis TaxID=2484901 RepID=A0A4R9LU03_9LEPT|nr:hypothetical protein [Leptospira ilyithenensis]TGN14062.1 hypothetical protein EHS11_02795 [Leptospira ilyithenensis]
MPTQPDSRLFDITNKVSQGGAPFNDFLSPDGSYYAFLSKVDINESNQADILFEVVNENWMNNVILKSELSLTKLPPPSPALLYHMVGVDPSALKQVLGLATDDDLVEGEWFLINIAKAASTSDPNQGHLYHPDLDMQES